MKSCLYEVFWKPVNAILVYWLLDLSITKFTSTRRSLLWNLKTFKRYLLTSVQSTMALNLLTPTDTKYVYSAQTYQYGWTGIKTREASYCCRFCFAMILIICIPVWHGLMSMFFLNYTIAIQAIHHVTDFVPDDHTIRSSLGKCNLSEPNTSLPWCYNKKVTAPWYTTCLKGKSTCTSNFTKRLCILWLCSSTCIHESNVLI